MNNKKICSFYASDIHLLTILIPYINEKILEGKDIIPILQNDFTNNVRKYLKNVKNLKCEKEKILNIEWKKSKNVLNEKIDSKEIFVVGKREFIDEMNNKIDKQCSNSEIVNCYRIDEKESINEILSSYCILLNTKGKMYYEKNSQNAQKRKTIKSQL